MELEASDMKFKVKVLIFLFQVFLSVCAAFAQGWDLQTAPAGDYVLMRCFMLNQDVAFAVGANRAILKTVNGGHFWRVISINYPISGNALYTICFADPNNGWAVGALGCILHTTDGGESWAQQSGGGNAIINSVSFCNSSTGTAAGYGIVLRTTDGGFTWVNQAAAAQYYLESVSVTDTSTAFAVGYNGIIIRTTDAGATWVNTCNNSNWQLTAVSFADGKHGVASGAADGFGIVVATTNGGETWTKKFQDTVTSRYMISVSCPDSLHWTAVGYGGLVIHTTNGGAKWFMEILNNGNADVSGVSFADSMNGIIVGFPKLIYHTTNGGSSSPRILLSHPPDGAANQPLSVTLGWYGSAVDSSVYRVQVSTDLSFLTGIVLDDSTVVDTFKTAGGLNTATTYYWRTRVTTPLGQGYWSRTRSFRTFSYLSAKYIQEVPADSLLIADTLQDAQPQRWRLQSSPSTGDSLTITAVCVIPPNVLTADNPVYTLVVYDTAEAESTWRGLIVRADSSVAGIQNVRAGQILQMRGRIYEEPPGSMNSLTVFEPRYITPTDSMTVSQAAKAHSYDFYDGVYPGGMVYYSTGEKYEGMIVELNDLTVASYIYNPAAGFSMVDGGGNMIAMFDASKWFTVRAHRDPSSTYSLPPLGAHISSIRGVVMVLPGSENGMGYCIVPVYPGDIVFGPSHGGRIMGTVFNDADDDSTRNMSETGMGRFHVWINGKANMRTRSDTAGLFMLSDLDSGAYVVSEANRPGWACTVPSSGSYSIRLGLNDTSSGSLFGNFYVGSLISGTVFYDRNQNGVMDYGDRSLQGWIVRLAGPKADSAYTDAKGNYRFLELPNGIFSLSVNLPGYWGQSHPQDQYAIAINREGDLHSGLNYGIYYSPRLRLTITVQDNTPFAYRDIWWGVTPLATYGIWGVDPHATVVDSAEGEFEIPPQTIGLFDARFQDPHRATLEHFGYGSWTDMRGFNAIAQIDTHLVVFLPGYFYGGDYPMTLRWSKETVGSSFKGPVTLSNTGGILADMKTSDSIVITNPTIYSLFLISHSPNISQKFQLNWNIVSAPMDYGDNSLKALYPSAVSHSFSYTPGVGYRVQDTLASGRGYWVKCVFALDSVAFSGNRQITGSTDTLHVIEGWNLIGGFSTAVNTGSISSTPDGIIASGFYGYNGGYYPAESLEPLKGYWVKAKTEGSLLLHTMKGSPAEARGDVNAGLIQEMLERFSRLIIRDANGLESVLYYTAGNNKMESLEYELPPAPPVGVFDVRFSTNRLAAVIGEGEKGLFPINVSGAEYPLEISWANETADAAASLMIGERETRMREGGTVKIPSPEVRIVLALAGSTDVPRAFSLEQNYPNPFNPVTTVRYSLPERALVRLKIYDLLGMEVKTLIDAVEEAGYKSVQWISDNNRGAGVASGLYFYRIDVARTKSPDKVFTQVRKMLLIR